jgi:membrane dipeptidase
MTSIEELLVAHPVIDGHNDLLWAMRDLNGYDFEAYDLGERQTQTHTDLPRLRAGGVGAQFWSVFVPCAEGERSVTSTLEQVDAAYRMIERYADRLAPATTADEVEAAWASGRIACLMGAEGGHQIAGSLGVLRMYHRLGVRYLTLTHNQNTPWADSATDEPRAGGLTAFGHEVVRECNRLGMLVDLAHVAPATMHAALATSAAPAFFSHSNARTLCDHPRNVPDDVLTLVRDSGGVVMTAFVPAFLTAECAAWFGELGEATANQAGVEREAAAADWVREHPLPPCTVADLADHIEHIRAVAGVDHVGLGGDFDGVAPLPHGVTGVDGYPSLIAELAARGWSDPDLAKLTWHNALRVLRETESVAREQRSRRAPSRATIAELDSARANVDG